MTDNPTTRPFQYSLRTLFIVTTVFAFMCSLVAYQMHRTRGRRAIESVATKINSSGGFAEYWDCGEELPALQCLTITDTGLVRLKDLTVLTWLQLLDAEITDAGLVHLEGFANLKELRPNS